MVALPPVEYYTLLWNQFWDGGWATLPPKDREAFVLTALWFCAIMSMVLFMTAMCCESLWYAWKEEEKEKDV